jgi:competence protein CoiA
MKYALVNDERQEAQPGLSGKCTCCGHTAIARCGELKIWHWAHKGKLICDPWWEKETEWHREWKGKFPKACQEIVHYAENGEKHIADVKNDQGYVIEFQHSLIKPEERKARENFYKTMIWIVDGTRRLRDKDKFIDVWEHSKRINNKVEVRKLWGYFDECALLRDWNGSSVPVFFDFGEDIIWGFLPKDFLPKTIEERRYVFRIKRNELVSYLHPESQMNFEVLLKELNKFLITEALSTLLQSPQGRDYSLHQRTRSCRKRF